MFKLMFIFIMILLVKLLIWIKVYCVLYNEYKNFVEGENKFIILFC